MHVHFIKIGSVKNMLCPVAVASAVVSQGPSASHLHVNLFYKTLIRR